jgi:hypothetical protein
MSHLALAPELPPHDPWALEEARETLAFPHKYDKERRAAARRVLTRDKAYRLRIMDEKREALLDRRSEVRDTPDRRDAFQVFNEEDR